MQSRREFAFTGLAALFPLTGTLIAERYYGGASPSDLWAINSITRSVTSMCRELERGRPLSTTGQTASFQTLTIA